MIWSTLFMCLRPVSALIEADAVAFALPRSRRSSAIRRVLAGGCRLIVIPVLGGSTACRQRTRGAPPRDTRAIDRLDRERAVSHFEAWYAWAIRCLLARGFRNRGHFKQAIYYHLG